MVTIKHLEIDGSLVFFDEYWTEEYGVLERSSVINTIYFLRGCVLDGIVYGDTSIPMGVRNEVQVINDFALGQNYPNPFNPSTTISYTIPSGGNVELIVYDALSQFLAVLVDEWQTAGNYSVEFISPNLSSGVYLYRLEYGDRSIIKKMILLK